MEKDQRDLIPVARPRLLSAASLAGSSTIDPLNKRQRVPALNLKISPGLKASNTDSKPSKNEQKNAAEKRRKKEDDPSSKKTTLPVRGTSSKPVSGKMTSNTVTESKSQSKSTYSKD